LALEFVVIDDPWHHCAAAPGPLVGFVKNICQSGYTIQIDLVLIFLVRILVVCANADMSASGLADIPYVAFDVAFGG